MTSTKESSLTKSIIYSAGITSLHSFMFGVNLSIFNTFKSIFVTDEKKASFIMNEYQWKHAVCIICIGALFSNVTICFLTIQRKPLLILNAIINLLGQLGIKFSTGPFFMIVSRLLIGVGAGLTTSLVPLYHLKLAPAHLKGVFGSLNQLFCVTGVFVAQLFSFYFNKEHNWSLGLNLVIAFVTLHMVGTFFIVKVDETSSSVQNKGVLDLLTHPNAKKSIFVVTMILIGQQISGIKSIIFYSEEIFEHTGNPKLYIGFLGFCLIMGTIVSMFIIDKFGRKKLLLYSCIIAASNHLLLAFNKMVFFAVFGFIIGYSIGLGPIPWFIAGELYPEEYKKAGTIIGISANWLTNYTLAMNFPKLLGYSTKCAFLPLFGALMGLFFYLCFFFPETKDRKPEFL